MQNYSTIAGFAQKNGIKIKDNATARQLGKWAPQVLIIDAKTGNPSGKDYGQVQSYRMAISIVGIHSTRNISFGQVFYKDSLCCDSDLDELTLGWQSDLNAPVAVKT